LGRKACPLGLPSARRIVAAETLAETFATFDRDMPESERVLRAPGARARQRLAARRRRRRRLA
jgi:hypothetical protein